MHVARHFVWGILCALLWPLGEAAAGSLKSSRFNGGEYVMVSEVAAFYNLGADRSQDQEIASYRAAHAQLSCQAERREIGLNGVTHWLSAPVLNERGRLWFSALDVLKTIDPVMRSARQKTPGTVRTVVVDAGHGGNDFGTHGQRSVEKTLTLDMAKRVRALLEAAGFRVVMTRTSDRAVSLDDRCEIAADKNADLLVSIHCNSGGTAQGVETFCATPAGAVSTSSSFNGWPRAAKEESTPGNRFDTQNIFLAHSIQRRLVAETDAVDRGVRRARFVVVRDAPCPAVLVETGFLSNATEEKKLLSPEYRDRVAKAVVAGIVEYRAAIERK
jgi:N-acetylmuramoyl-L-alanine amidase